VDVLYLQLMLHPPSLKVRYHLPGKGRLVMQQSYAIMLGKSSLMLFVCQEFSCCLDYSPNDMLVQNRSFCSAANKTSSAKTLCLFCRSCVSFVTICANGVQRLKLCWCLHVGLHFRLLFLATVITFQFLCCQVCREYWRDNRTMANETALAWCCSSAASTSISASACMA